MKRNDKLEAVAEAARENRAAVADAHNEREMSAELMAAAKRVGETGAALDDALTTLAASPDVYTGEGAAESAWDWYCDPEGMSDLLRPVGEDFRAGYEAALRALGAVDPQREEG